MSKESKVASSGAVEIQQSSASPSWHAKGLRDRYPELHEWLTKRMGTRDSLCLVVSFAAFEVLRFVASEFSYVRTVNPHSIKTVASGVSLVIAISTSLVFDGTQAFGQIFSWRPMWRFVGVALLFAMAGWFDLLALAFGATSAQVVTVGYIFLPISAIVSYFVFARRYGRLEWIAMGMLTLGILTFVFLREQSKGETLSDIEKIRSQYSILGLFLIVCAVVASVFGSIVAERIFKDRSKGLKWWSARFYVMKVHLDFGQFVIGGFIWALPHFWDQPPTFIIGTASHFSKAWFGDWTWRQGLMVFALIGQSWLAGLVVKEFSTVVRALTQSMTLILVMCVEDPIMGNRYHFLAREVPTVILTVIIFLSAMIFQTGRINVQDIRNARTAALMNRDMEVGDAEQGTTGTLPPTPGTHDAERFRTTSPPGSSACSTLSNGSMADAALLKIAAQLVVENRLSVSEAEARSQRIAEQQSSRRWTLNNSGSEAHESQDTSRCQNWKHTCCKVVFATYSLVAVYTISDAARNLLLQRAMASTRINANSMGVMQYLSGIAAAAGLTMFTHGRAGIKDALRWRKILKCFPAGFLFAVQATLMNMAYSRGISAALALILGRVYIPVAAMGARCVLGKFYMWLEYAAIGILTLSTMAFGYLKAFDVTSVDDPDGDSDTKLAALLVMASATTAAFNSLLTERLLKDEKVAFHLQKMRLDIASSISAMVLIPIVAVITTRVQDIPWVERPESATCTNPVCWDLDEGTCGNPACTCECAEGVFAGWTAETLPLILLALFVGTAYNWLVGKLVQRFSTVTRCIADSFSLLLIYFVGDPAFNHTSLDNMCINLIAFIVPLSSALFAVSAAEMQWATSATAVIRETGMVLRSSSRLHFNEVGVPQRLLEAAPSNTASTKSDEEAHSAFQSTDSDGSRSGSFGDGSLEQRRRTKEHHLDEEEEEEEEAEEGGLEAEASGDKRIRGEKSHMRDFVEEELRSEERRAEMTAPASQSRPTYGSSARPEVCEARVFPEHMAEMPLPVLIRAVQGPGQVARRSLGCDPCHGKTLHTNSFASPR